MCVAIETQESSSPKEHWPLWSCSSFMYFWFFWGRVLWGISHEKRGKLRQTDFSMGYWDALEVVFNPGRSLAVGLVIGVPLGMSPEEDV